MTDVSYETPGVLDLSGADTSGFEPLPPDRYPGAVWEATWKATKEGGSGKLPTGTPMLSVQFVINDEARNISNRRVFANYFPVSPPADQYDAAKAAKLQGSFVNFLGALGYSEEDVKSGKFALDLDDLKGKECILILGAPDKGYTSNKVNGVKPVGDTSGAGAASSGLV